MKIIHENIFKELINGIRGAISKNPGAAIIWCGENAWLYRILEILDSVDIRISTVIDNSFKKVGIKTKLYEIYSFEYVLNADENSIYFICNLRSQEIVEQLMSLGVKRDCIYIFRPIEYITQKFEENFVYEMYDKEFLTHEKLQSTLFELLVYFRDFCKENGLRYYLYDGTLIGAVRHKGYIPWDDDIDVAMPYEDYIKLLQLFRDSENYSLVSWNRDENYEFSLPRIVDNRTRMTIPGNTIIGAYLDIFLLGGYPSEQTKIDLKWSQYKEAEKQWHTYYVLRDTILNVDDIRNNIFERLYDIPFDKANYIGVMRTERQNAWVAPKEWFEDTVELEFCGEKFSAPSAYEEYLTMKYGNYMTIPEVNKRDMHGFRVYKIT
ncbi:MAG: LicD family protein [Pseudobutyrivibrio sp.]|nr:LicD family protein [Pseudobutyrivibrio sp.]